MKIYFFLSQGFESKLWCKIVIKYNFMMSRIHRPPDRVEMVREFQNFLARSGPWSGPKFLIFFGSATVQSCEFWPVDPNMVA